jgi:hypothetical protein
MCDRTYLVPPIACQGSYFISAFNVPCRVLASRGGVTTAQLIGLIVVFIYAVFGLQFFADLAPVKHVSRKIKKFTAHRGLIVSCLQDSFGTFNRAVVTLVSFISTLQVRRTRT